MGISREDVKGNYSEALVSSICAKVAQTGDFLAFVKEFMYDEDPIVVRNALSALSRATNAELEQLEPIKDELIDLAIRCTNPSIRRALFGIIQRMKMREEEVRTDFLDHCLGQMAHPDEVPSVQALCMKLAYKMCRFYPELMDELRRTLEAMEMSYYTPAVKSVRNKILQANTKKNNPYGS